MKGAFNPKLGTPPFSPSVQFARRPVPESSRSWTDPCYASRSSAWLIGSLPGRCGSFRSLPYHLALARSAYLSPPSSCCCVPPFVGCYISTQEGVPWSGSRSRKPGTEGQKTPPIDKPKLARTGSLSKFKVKPRGAMLE